MDHKTRYSDSSIYDEVCTICGATDANGDDRLKYPCPGDAELSSRQAAERRVERARAALLDAENELKQLEA